jgi:hypothetical protein
MTAVAACVIKTTFPYYERLHLSRLGEIVFMKNISYTW